MGTQICVMYSTGPHIGNVSSEVLLVMSLISIVLFFAGPLYFKLWVRRATAKRQKKDSVQSVRKAKRRKKRKRKE